MPILAKHDAEQCCAFDKSDHRRCRLTREDGKLTCKIHKTYYTRWLVYNEALPNHLLTKRKHEEHTFQFRNGYVDPLKGHNFDWFMQETYFGPFSHYILLLLKETRFTLANYPSYIKHLVSTEIGSRLHLPLDEQVIAWQHLLPYLKDPQTLLMFLQSTIEYLIGYSFMTANHIHISVVFSTFVNGPLPWSMLLYANSITHVAERARDAFILGHIIDQEQRQFINQFVETYINPVLVHFHNSHRFPYRHKTAQIKEDLCMNVFHPRRIEHLIETYGIDILEELW